MANAGEFSKGNEKDCGFRKGERMKPGCLYLVSLNSFLYSTSDAVASASALKPKMTFADMQMGMLDKVVFISTIASYGLVLVWAFSRIVMLVPQSQFFLKLQQSCGFEPNAVFLPRETRNLWRSLLHQHCLLLLIAVIRLFTSLNNDERAYFIEALMVWALILLLYRLHCFRFASLILFDPGAKPFRELDTKYLFLAACWFCVLIVTLPVTLIVVMSISSVQVNKGGEGVPTAELAAMGAGYIMATLLLVLCMALVLLERQLRKIANDYFSEENYFSKDELQRWGMIHTDSCTQFLNTLYGVSPYSQTVGAFATVVALGSFLHSLMYFLGAQPVVMYNELLRTVLRIAYRAVELAILVTLLSALRMHYLGYLNDLEDDKSSRSLSVALLSGISHTSPSHHQPTPAHVGHSARAAYQNMSESFDVHDHVREELAAGAVLAGISHSHTSPSHHQPTPAHVGHSDHQPTSAHVGHSAYAAHHGTHHESFDVHGMHREAFDMHMDFAMDD
eukprot:g947.t1